MSSARKTNKHIKKHKKQKISQKGPLNQENTQNNHFLTQEQLAEITLLEEELEQLHEEKNNLRRSFMISLVNLLFLGEAISNRIIETLSILKPAFETFITKEKNDASQAEEQNDWRIDIALFVSIYSLLIGTAFLEKKVAKEIYRLLLNSDGKKSSSIKNEFLTPSAADERIDALNKECESLELSHGENRGWAFLTIAIFYNFLNQENNIGPFTRPLFILHFLSHAITSLNGHFFKYVKKSRFLQNQSNNYFALHEITKNYQAKLIFCKKRTLEQSYFIFEAKAYEKYETDQEATTDRSPTVLISEKIVCQIVRSVLLKSGIHILSYGRTRMLISAYDSPDPRSTSKIAKDIDDAIDRHLAYRALKKQVGNITTAIEEKYWLTFCKNSQGSMTYHFLLPVPAGYESLMTIEKIQPIFGSCKIVVGPRHFSIEGDVPGNGPLLENFILEIAELKNEIRKSYSQEMSHAAEKTPACDTLTGPLLALPKKSSSNPFFKPTKTSTYSTHTKFPLENKTENVNNTGPEEDSIIRWEAGTYDPKSDNNTIVPIRSTHCAKNHKFLLFGLSREHFPNEQYYSAHHKVTESPKWGGKHGQCIKGCNETVKHAVTGKPVDADCKSKPDGQGGIAASRMYFVGQRSLTQKGQNTLYVGVSFNRNPHQD